MLQFYLCPFSDMGVLPYGTVLSVCYPTVLLYLDPICGYLMVLPVATLLSYCTCVRPYGPICVLPYSPDYLCPFSDIIPRLDAPSRNSFSRASSPSFLPTRNGTFMRLRHGSSTGHLHGQIRERYYGDGKHINLETRDLYNEVNG